MLKATQSYPDEFGVAVAALFAKHREALGLAAHAFERDAMSACWHFDPLGAVDGPWADASLHDVFSLLGA